ncbi:MAG: DUF4880 domain-containing protein [Nitrosomonas sp.]|nr:DUF4880 domain-containing protein [Nitrosomonas sp.]
MPESTDSDTISLSEQAAEWAVCLSGDQISNKQRADFETWLALDPRHREAYEQIDHLWRSVTPPETKVTCRNQGTPGHCIVAGQSLWAFSFRVVG